MIDTKLLIDNLANGPVILQNLLCPIPDKIMKIRRVKGKWSIHEHACHIVNTEAIIMDQFEKFVNEAMPFFDTSFNPLAIADESLLNLDLNKELDRLVSLRQEMIKLLREFNGSMWNKQGIHAQYALYNPYILLRHTQMHENFHMYRIQQLWLTKAEYLS